MNTRRDLAGNMVAFLKFTNAPFVICECLSGRTLGYFALQKVGDSPLNLPLSYSRLERIDPIIWQANSGVLVIFKCNGEAPNFDKTDEPGRFKTCEFDPNPLFGTPDLVDFFLTAADDPLNDAPLTFPL